jgi:hypothetical protein
VIGLARGTHLAAAVGFFVFESPKVLRLLVLVVAVIGLSLPEAIILRRVLKPRLIGVFIGVVGTGILIVGYLFSLVLRTLVAEPGL